MKRRAFIGNTLSVLSLTMLEYQIAGAHQLSFGLNKNVAERFFEKFDFELFKDCWSDASFVKLYEETSESFLKSNYELPDKSAFLLPRFNLAVIPLELKVPSLGCIDRGFLFYEQLPNAEWKYVKSINSYEAETLVRAVDAITSQLPQQQVADCLLPHYSKEQKPRSYATRTGHVAMKITMDASGMASTIQVWDRQEAFFQQTYDLSRRLELAV